MINVEYPLIWRQWVVDKIWKKHHVTPEEVEEAIFDDKPIWHKGTATSYCAYGQAMSGRYLFVVLAKTARRSRYKAITARDMQQKEKRYYRKHVN